METKINPEKDMIEALNKLEKEKGISKEKLLETLESSMLVACEKEFGNAENIQINIDRETGAVKVYANKTIVEEVMDPALELTLEEAKKYHPRKKYSIGDQVLVEVTPMNFGRIATQKAKQVVIQRIREEERKAIYDQFYDKSRDVVTGIIGRSSGKNITVNLGKCDAVLTEKEQIKTENYTPSSRFKFYVLDVQNTGKGPKIVVSRTHPELVRKLFEAEVTEVHDGIVTINSIAREAGQRTKMAVSSNDPDVDPTGACVGVNGARVNAIVDELGGEKIDIINWSDDPAILIKNALGPAKVLSVDVYDDEKCARVIVPDNQLSLAIGKEGQNARLAAKLTGYKIDIKSESQAGDIY
jgi:N utilization substance protein A